MSGLFAEDGPIPPRFVWAKRAVLFALAWLTFLVVVRLAWGAYAKHHLDATVARLRAAGQPLLPEDVQQPPVPDELNGITHYARALELLPDIPAGHIDWELVHTDPELCAEYPDYLADLYDRTASALATVRKAREAPYLVWNNPLVHDDRTGPNSYVALRNLWKTVIAAAYFEHSRGRDAAAVELLLDALAVAAARVRDDSGGFAYGIGCTMFGGTARAVAQLGLTLSIAGAAGAHSDHACPADRIEALIAELIVRDCCAEYWSSAVDAHIAAGRVWVERFIAGEAPLKHVGEYYECTTPDWLMRAAQGPRFRLDIARWIDTSAVVRDAGWLDRRAAFVLRFPERESHGGDDVPIRLGLVDAFDHAIVKFMFEEATRARATARIAAVVLANRGFVIEHGRDAAGYHELIPRYLPVAPRDPYAPPPILLRFEPSWDPPVVYSVGKNGVDDGASGELYSFSADLVATLTPQPAEGRYTHDFTYPEPVPATPHEKHAAAQTADDDEPDESDDGEADDEDDETPDPERN